MRLLGIRVTGEKNHTGAIVGHFLYGFGTGTFGIDVFLEQKFYAHGIAGFANTAVLGGVPAFLMNATEQDDAGFRLGLVEGAGGKNPTGSGQYN